MENASKALIIAGAILISILIIGLGVAVYQAASGTVKRANLNSQEALAQNEQFENFFGNQRTAQDVKQLCSIVRSNNITGDTGEETKNVTLLFGKGSDGKGNINQDATFEVKSPNTLSAAVRTGSTYYINVYDDKASDDAAATDGATEFSKVTGYYKSGYIKTIVVIQNGSTTGSGNGQSQQQGQGS